MDVMEKYRVIRAASLGYNADYFDGRGRVTVPTADGTLIAGDLDLQKFILGLPHVCFDGVYDGNSPVLTSPRVLSYTLYGGDPKAGLGGRIHYDRSGAEVTLDSGTANLYSILGVFYASNDNIPIVYGKPSGGGDPVWAIYHIPTPGRILWGIRNSDGSWTTRNLLHVGNMKGAYVLEVRLNRDGNVVVFINGEQVLDSGFTLVDNADVVVFGGPSVSIANQTKDAFAGKWFKFSIGTWQAPVSGDIAQYLLALARAASEE